MPQGIKELDELDFDYSYFVYGLVKQLKPKVVFEVGLGDNAYTGASVAQALEENSRQRYTWYNQETHTPIEGKYFVIEIDPTTTAMERLERFPKKYWEVIVGNSENPDLYNLDTEFYADIVLVDGDHSEERAYGDTKIVMESNILNPDDGLIVFHDTYMSCSERGTGPVAKAMKRIEKDFNLEIFQVSKRQSFSIGRPKNQICHPKLDFY
ncbi:hypothetical protein CL634_05420 [bacterium]|nr:hypothetical protein [bacterium]